MALINLPFIGRVLLLIGLLSIAAAAGALIFGLISYGLATAIMFLLRDLGFDVFERLEVYFHKKDWITRKIGELRSTSLFSRRQIKKRLI